MNRKALLILFLVLMPLTASIYAQNVTVSGIVQDSLSKESLIGVNVHCAQKGTVTDNDGRYSISIPRESPDSLVFSYSGYESLSIPVPKQDTTLMVFLKQGLELEGARIYDTSSGFHSTLTGLLELPVASIQKAPVLLGEADVLKTLQLLPGVQSGTEGFSSIFVRGGGPDENLFLLDGIPIYNVNHLLGLFSSFTPEAIKRVSLYKSSFPARFGGRVSSVVDIRTNEGSADAIHGTIGIGVLTNKLHLEGPLFSEASTFSITGRFMNSIFLSPIIKLTGSDANYYFYDINFKLTHRLSQKDKFFVSGYSGNDTFYLHDAEKQNIDDESLDSSDMDWGTSVAALQWNHVFNGKWQSRITAAYSRYKMDSQYSERASDNDGQILYNSLFRSGIQDYSMVADFDYFPSPENTFHFGISSVMHHYMPQTRHTRTIQEQPNLNSDHSSEQDYLGWETSLYVEDDVYLLPDWSLNAGLRYVLMTPEGKSYSSLEPRVSSKYKFLSILAFKASYSRISQYVHLLSSSQLSLPTDIWVPITPKIKPVLSDHYSAGVYYEGEKGWEVSLEAYFKHSNNVLDYRDGISMFGTTAGWDEVVEQGEGRSRGLELFVRKMSGKTTGWFSYTLSKSDRRFPNGYINKGEWFPNKYDRRHVMSLFAETRLSKRTNLSITWSFMSGACITLPERTTVILGMTENKFSAEPMSFNGQPLIVNHISSRNNYRLPSSHYLNLALNYNKAKKRGTSAWSFGIYNVYNQMNPNLVYINVRSEDDVRSGEPVSITQLTMLPFLPSVSYNYRF